MKQIGQKEKFEFVFLYDKKDSVRLLEGLTENKFQFTITPTIHIMKVQVAVVCTIKTAEIVRRLFIQKLAD